MHKEQPSMVLVGDENARLSVTWGRSGKRVILTIFSTRFPAEQQILLTRDQSEELASFLHAGPS